MRVAIIGTGIAGNAAAWTLSKQYPVTVYDRELRPGGHSHTVTIDYDGTPLAVERREPLEQRIHHAPLRLARDDRGIERVRFRAVHEHEIGALCLESATRQRNPESQTHPENGGRAWGFAGQPASRMAAPRERQIAATARGAIEVF